MLIILCSSSVNSFQGFAQCKHDSNNYKIGNIKRRFVFYVVLERLDTGKWQMTSAQFLFSPSVDLFPTLRMADTEIRLRTDIQGGALWVSRASPESLSEEATLTTIHGQCTDKPTGNRLSFLSTRTWWWALFQKEIIPCSSFLGLCSSIPHEDSWVGCHCMVFLVDRTCTLEV